MACTSQIEIPYYSGGMYKNVCTYCGSEHMLALTQTANPKCSRHADKPDVIKKKRKSIAPENMKQTNKTRLIF